MNVVISIVTVLYLINAALLVIAILLQSGKGGGITGAFGGGGAADSAFGAQVGSPLRKVTAVMATFFLAVALALAIITPKQKALEGDKPAVTQEDSDKQSGDLKEKPADSKEAPKADDSTSK